MTRYLAGKVAGLAGADISPLLLEQARQAIPGGDFRLTDGAQLPFDSDSFDLVFATCAMHHVPPADRLGLLREMARVSTPLGLIVIMEHNPLNPLTRLAVARCEFDTGCVLLGMGCTRRLFRQADLHLLGGSYIAFFPWRGRPWRLVEKALRRVPLGAQYFVAGRK
jgi:ubiquinone/menaquinone biosynthesis C-methylase UbiE